MTDRVDDNFGYLDSALIEIEICDIEPLKQDKINEDTHRSLSLRASICLSICYFFSFFSLYTSSICNCKFKRKTAFGYQKAQHPIKEETAGLKTKQRTKTSSTL